MASSSQRDDQPARRRFAVSVAWLAALALSGCHVTPPSLLSPGDLTRQRTRAVMFDPYSDVDIGPEVVGGRPREFQRPLPQADRNDLVQQFQTPVLGGASPALLPPQGR